MLLLLLLATTPFLAAAAAAGVPCSVLNPGLELGAGGLFTATNATVIAAGAPINFTNAAYNITTAGVLPAFCRVQLTVHTNPAANASAHAEVWLPEPSAWNGRVLGTGNGGLSGGVQMGDLGDNGIMLGFAAFGTDTGHQSDTNGASWAVGNPEALIDFGYRALHMTTQSAKIVVANYYGQAAKKSYYLGCSTGGRQALKEVQMFPDDFDGVVFGSPANWQTHLQPWGLRMASHVQPVNGSSWLDTSHWAAVHAEVMRQCDAIDGVVDNIIGNPQRCQFRPETLACRPSTNTSTVCLNSAQIGALKKIYSPWVDVNQTYVFGGYEVGGEMAYSSKGLVAEKPLAIALNYMQYMVYNTTTPVDYTYSNYADALKADAEDPGQQDAMSPDLRAFVARGGKLLHYYGHADQLISPGNSRHYYNMVEEFMNENTELNINDYYRLFPVAGMNHCRGGDGANSFGNQGLGYATPYHNTSHNALVAMVDWIENGNAPSKLIATKFIGDYAPLGVNFTRPICAFPQEVRYMGTGSIWNASSFECA